MLGYRALNKGVRGIEEKRNTHLAKIVNNLNVVNQILILKILMNWKMFHLMIF